MTAELEDICLNNKQPAQLPEAVDVSGTSQNNTEQLLSNPEPNFKRLNEGDNGNCKNLVLQNQRFERFLLAFAKASAVGMSSTMKVGCRLFAIYIR